MIEWDGETGYEISSGGKSLVYTRKRMLDVVIWEAVECAVRGVWKIRNGKKDEAFVRVYRSESIRRARPRIWDADKALKLVIARVSEEIVERAAPRWAEMPREALSDAQFLAVLGLGRNYRSECVICLSEEMMGTTCTCGHTEIIVFRPCGHSVCNRPCFEAMCKNRKIAPPKPHTFRFAAGSNIGEIVHRAGEKTFSRAEKLECPTCRARIARTFQAEDVEVDREWIPKDLNAEARSLLRY